MHKRNSTPGSLALLIAVGYLTSSPLLATDLAVDGSINVKNNAVILQSTSILENLGVGFRAGPAAKVQILQAGTGVGLFLGNRAPFGQALLQTDLTTSGTHAWFAENGQRVFSVAGGGDGFFKGNLDVGGDTTLKGITLLEHGQIKEELFIGVGGATRSVAAPVGGIPGLGPGRGDPNNSKLRVEGNVTIDGSHFLNGNQTLTGTENFGSQTRQMINLWKNEYGIGVQAAALYLRTSGDFFWYRGGAHNDNNGNGGGGAQLMKLDASGQLLVASRVVTPVLQITGGADVAEPFNMSLRDIPRGSVVIIDEENEGYLKLSEGAYDRRVSGIVSGANGIHPGISLSQQGVLEGGQNVALSGRVYVLADASSNPIKPGDLLTTSDTPGYAMKVTDHARAQGAVLGKAMSGMKEGRGMVLVLVSLQ